MPGRMIDRSVLTHHVLIEQPLAARYLWVALILLSDDEGRVNCSWSYIGRVVFGGIRGIGPTLVEHWLGQWSDEGMASVEETSSRKFLRFNNWARWQRLKTPRESTRKGKEDEGKGKEDEGNKERKKKAPRGPRFDASPYVVWWNAIASEQGLKPVKVLGARRTGQLQRRLKAFPDLREQVTAELRARGPWARENAQPTLNWLLKSDDNLAEFLEGKYRPTPADERAELSQDSHKLARMNLVRALQRHVGRQTKRGSSIGKFGITGFNGVEDKWEDIPMADLERIVEEFESR